jgi:WD40 repeat protein
MLFKDKEPQTTVKCLGTLIGHLSTVTCLLFYNDDLISADLDDNIKIWDVSLKYKCIKTLQPDTGGVATITLKENFLYSVGEVVIKVTVSYLCINKYHQSEM